MAKKDKLAGMLIQKLQNKYGGSARANREIEQHVRRFVSSASHIGGRELAQLEKDVREAVDIAEAVRAVNTEAGPSGGASGAAAAGGAGGASAGTGGDAGHRQGGNAREVDIVLPPQAANDWVLLDMYKAVQNEEKVKEDARKALEKKRQLRALLDQQRQERELAKRQDDGGDSKYVQSIVSDVEKFKQEQEAFRRKVAQDHDRELRLQLHAMKEKEERKKVERVVRIQREQAEIRVITAEMKDEEDDVRRKREDEHRQAALIRIENEKEERRREERRRLEAEEDHRMMQAYAAKLEQEERDRAEAFQKRMEKSALSGEKWASEGAGKKQREEQLRFEQLLLREQARKEAADKEREDREERERVSRNRHMLKDNDVILAAKELRKREQQVEEERMRLKYLNDSEQQAREEREKRERERVQKDAYRRMLNQQMQEHTQQRREDMSDLERRLNMDMIKKVKEDKATLAKVAERLSAKSNSPRPRNSIFPGAGGK